MKYASVPKLALLKLLFNAWQRLGSPFPRGYVSPNLASTRNSLAMVMNILGEMHAGVLDPDRMTKDEWEDAIYALAAKNDIGN